MLTTVVKTEMSKGNNKKKVEKSLQLKESGYLVTNPYIDFHRLLSMILKRRAIIDVTLLGLRQQWKR